MNNETNLSARGGWYDMAKKKNIYIYSTVIAYYYIVIFARKSASK